MQICHLVLGWVESGGWMMSEVRAEQCTCAGSVQSWLLGLGNQGDYCGTATASFDPVGVTVSTCWLCFCQTPCGFFFFVQSIYQRRKLSLVVRQVKRKCSVVLGISEGIWWNEECTAGSTASWCFLWNRRSRGKFVNLFHQIIILYQVKLQPSAQTLTWWQQYLCTVRIFWQLSGRKRFSQTLAMPVFWFCCFCAR